MQPQNDNRDISEQTNTPTSPAPQQPVQEPVVTMQPDAAKDTMTMQPGEPAKAPEIPATDTQEPIRWQGTEYIHHEKDALWFVVFGLIVLVLMTISILALQSITFTVLIPVMAAALVVYTRRPPRLIEYTLSSQGLFVNDQLYPFGDFKGFGVINDHREYSIMLIPTKRFRLGVSIYFPEEAGEAIVDMLGARLPMREMQLDLFDRIIHKLRI